MSSGKRPIVKRLPRRFIKGQLAQFSGELQPLLRADRPRLIFDFSAVQEFDRCGAETLLHCLQQVLKENGDIKFAALPPATAVILELTGTDQLFEIYPTVLEAVESFQQSPGKTFRPLRESWPTPEHHTATTQPAENLDLAND
jgi:anti-anti-sigma factor